MKLPKNTYSLLLLYNKQGQNNWLINFCTIKTGQNILNNAQLWVMSYNHQ